MRICLAILAAVFLVGCNTHTHTHTAHMAKSGAHSGADSARLAGVLAQQEDAAKARYKARHPQETLEFFGIAPGMTVVEALPGGGWYSKILLPYLGEDGRLVGIDYSQEMWPLFGFFPPDAIEKKKTWVTDWTEEANGWRGEGDATVSAAKFGEMPARLTGKADAVLFIRALHNLNRFEDDGGYLSVALADARRVLKSGGIVGVVQHRAPAGAPTGSVSGSRGYLKQDDVIAFMENAGFEFEGSSEINANPKDNPGVEDVVWRLPPTLFTSREDEELREKMNSIGESDRMTLKFRKP